MPKYVLEVLRLIVIGRCCPAQQPTYGTRNHCRTEPLHQSCVSYLERCRQSHGGGFNALSRGTDDAAFEGVHHTHPDDVGDRVWTLLNSMTGIRRLSVFSLECALEWDKPPRVLQGWAAQLGPTLRHLELAVSFLMSVCEVMHTHPVNSIVQVHLLSH